MSERRPFLSTSFRIDGVFDVVIFLALSGSWLGLLGRWHWALDLLSHFRWQYLAASVVAVLWTLWRRRRPMLLISMATLLLNGWLIASLLTGSHGEAPPLAERLRVVSLNVLTSNRNLEGVLQCLREADADVIFLMEVDQRWEMGLTALKPAYSHGVMHSREDNFGVALMSRVPLQSAEIVVLGDLALPSVEARLTHAGRELIILGTHPLPPVGQERTARRDAQLREVATYAANAALPLLLIGDLNASPWSNGMTIVTSGNNLRLGGGIQDTLPTWNAGSPLGTPVDHALCSPPLRILRKRIGPPVGSDHRPIEIEVSWQRR